MIPTNRKENTKKTLQNNIKTNYPDTQIWSWISLTQIWMKLDSLPCQIRPSPCNSPCLPFEAKANPTIANTRIPTRNQTWSNTHNLPYTKPDNPPSKTEPDPILATTDWIQPITKDTSNADARTKAVVKERLRSAKVQVDVS